MISRIQHTNSKTCILEMAGLNSVWKMWYKHRKIETTAYTIIVMNSTDYIEQNYFQVWPVKITGYLVINT